MQQQQAQAPYQGYPSAPSPQGGYYQQQAQPPAQQGGYYPGMQHSPGPAGQQAPPQSQQAPPQQTPSGMFTRNLIGSLSASAFKLTDPDNKIGVWFILQDLSVRTEGLFRYVRARPCGRRPPLTRADSR